MAAIDFLGIYPGAQIIGVPSSQDDIHTLLVSSLVAISLPTPSKFQKPPEIRLSPRSNLLDFV
jgi:hypothetical protein